MIKTLKTKATLIAAKTQLAISGELMLVIGVVALAVAELAYRAI